MGDEEQTRSNPLGISVLGKLPKYDGKSNIRYFLRTIDKRAKLEKWSDDDKATVVRYLCIGLAESFLDANPEVEDYNYKEICDCLKERFETKLSKAEAYAEILAIKQNRRSVADYAGEIESKSADLIDTIPELKDSDDREELLTSVFLNSIDAHIKRPLIVNEYDEFAEIVKAAKRFENTSNDSRRAVAAMQNENTRNEPPTRFENNARKEFPNVVCWNCGKHGHISRYCRLPPQNRNTGTNRFRQPNPPSFAFQPRSNESFQRPYFRPRNDYWQNRHCGCTDSCNCNTGKN